jgi:ABC-type phosphate/phosphonate transport system substrate-binding protein
VGEILDQAGVGRVIATPEFEEDANQARALLVVSAESEIESIEGLRGKRIVFGPIGDSVTHIAALKMLDANGIAKDDIPRELLPIPGTLRHSLGSLDAGRAVIYEKGLGISGGFVLERDYENWPDTGGSLLLLVNAKDQLRVLGKTEVVPSLPEGPVLAGANVDAELVEKMRVFLTEELPRNKGICAKLGLRGYRAVGDVEAVDDAEPSEASSETQVSQSD